MSLRIDSTHQTESFSREAPSPSEHNNLEFNKFLSGTQRLQQRELNDFLKRLNTQGEKLATSLSLRDVDDFKTMVKLFLRSTFGQSRSMQENTSWDFSGRPKILAKISKINHHLEDLGRKVINEQTKPLDILTKIDEIRGLIVDLFT
jgi:Uncharacterized protein conserved in bacteria